MRKLILVIVLWFCTVALAADVVLQFTIPEEYTSRALNALTDCKNSRITISIVSNLPENYGSYVLEANYPFNEIEGESNLDYSKRFIRTMIKQIVIAYETKVRDENVQAQIEAIEIPEVNVPDEIVQ